MYAVKVIVAVVDEPAGTVTEARPVPSGLGHVTTTCAEADVVPGLRRVTMNFTKEP
jgi:hypothetical protein